MEKGTSCLGHRRIVGIWSGAFKLSEKGRGNGEMLQGNEDWAIEEIVPIRDKVYAYLKHAILHGEFKTGERLVERDLAEKLKISRTPIREALLRLESQGFVTTVPRKGVIVSQFSVEQVLEVFSILSALEVLAVQFAAAKIDEKTAKELDAFLQEIDLYLDGKGSGDVSSFHLKIHDTIYRLGRSQRLYDMLTDLEQYIRAFANVGHEVPGRKMEALHEHRQILQAIRMGNVAKAVTLTQNHIENSRNAYIHAMKTLKN
jgi:DNA-binding GntR family transcriptional regulator